MKKLLSVVLSTAIAVTSLTSVQLFTSATVTGGMGVVFDSAKAQSDWLLPHDGSITDGWVSSGTATVPGLGYTQGILAANGVENTKVTDFEWQFDFKSGNANDESTIFLFRVDEERDNGYPTKMGVSNVIQMQAYSGAFGVALQGSNNGIPRCGEEPLALSVIVPTDTSAVSRPLGNVSFNPNDTGNPENAEKAKAYYEKRYGVTYDRNNYTANNINFPCVPEGQSFSSDGTIKDTNDHFPDGGYLTLKKKDSQSAIDISDWMTINMKLKGQYLTITAWQTSDEAGTKRSGTYWLAKENGDTKAFDEWVPSGDFAITTYARNDKQLKGTTREIKNMTIKAETTGENEGEGLVFDSAKLNRANDDWIGLSNPDYDNKGTLVSNGFGWGKGSRSKDAYWMPNNAVTTSILNQNGYKGTIKGDFIWETDFIPGNTSWTSTTFLFHVDKDGLPTGSEQKGVIDSTLGVTVNGYKVAASNGGPNIIRIDDVHVGHISSVGSTSISGVNRAISSVGIVGPTKPSDGFPDGVLTYKTHTLRLVMKGNTLYVSMWQSDDKENTYVSFSYEYSAEQMAAATGGDFAIANGNSDFYVVNTRIWRGAEAFDAATAGYDANGNSAINICDLVKLGKSDANNKFAEVRKLLLHEWDY